VDINRQDSPLPRADLLDRIGDKDGLLCMITDQIDRELLDRAPHLKIIANFGVGYNNIDLQAATDRKIMVTNTPGVLTDATADITLALILATGRRLVEGDRRTRNGSFKAWAPFNFLGQEISGKILGIVGLGRIGQAVARRAAGFGMSLLYCSRTRMSPEMENRLKVHYCAFDRLISEADYISINVPLTPETHHLIGKREFDLMKSSACLINTSRGPVVDEAALVQALRERKIMAAGLDVYENEPALAPGLAELDNTVLLPHVGSATLETRTRMAEMATENLLAALEGRMPPNCLNCQKDYDSHSELS